MYGKNRNRGRSHFSSDLNIFIYYHIIIAERQICAVSLPVCVAKKLRSYSALRRLCLNRELGNRNI